MTGSKVESSNDVEGVESVVFAAGGPKHLAQFLGLQSSIAS